MQEVSLTGEARSVLVGTLLGDGYLGLSSCGSKANPFLQIGRSVKDVGYLIWQHKILSAGGLVTAPIKYRQGYDQRYNKTYYGCYLYSRYHPILWEFYNRFYPDERTKVVTSDILKQVTPLALAVWYMDDGSLTKQKGSNSHTLKLHTQSFGRTGNELIQEWFLSGWGISTGLGYDKTHNSYVIAIYKWAEISKFIAVVEPYILPCMERKLPRERFLPERKRAFAPGRGRGS